MTANTQECILFVIFGLPLFCTREHIAHLRVIVIVVFEGQFFLKTMPDIGYRKIVYILRIGLQYFKDNNLWSPLAPLLGEIDIYAH